MTNMEKTLEEIRASVKGVSETSAQQENQRMIDKVTTEKGITEGELQAVYQEYGGNVQDINALAEIAASRKSATEGSQERTKQASDERKTAATKVSGGGQSTTTDAGGKTESRKLTGKAKYSGAEIAKNYKAFGESATQ